MQTWILVLNHSANLEKHEMFLNGDVHALEQALLDSDEMKTSLSRSQLPAKKAYHCESCLLFLPMSPFLFVLWTMAI